MCTCHTGFFFSLNRAIKAYGYIQLRFSTSALQVNYKNAFLFFLDIIQKPKSNDKDLADETQSKESAE